MERRNFIKAGFKGFVAVTLLPKVGYSFFTNEIFDGGGCIPTTADILGPFYRANAPFRANLQILGEPGIPLIYKGTVYDLDCNPLPNALIEVWQADDAGAYDNTSPDFKYRASQYSDALGQYEFTSIHAGRYLNGAQYRPSHIHFRVTAPGIAELITQLYFTGDPYISADPWASDPDAALRIVPINNVGGVDTAIFDIKITGHLNAAIEAADMDIEITPTYGGLNFTSPKINMDLIEVMDLSGRLVKGYYNINSKEFTIGTGELATGTYFARIQLGKKITVHKFQY